MQSRRLEHTWRNAQVYQRTKRLSLADRQAYTDKEVSIIQEACLKENLSIIFRVLIISNNCPIHLQTFPPMVHRDSDRGLKIPQNVLIAQIN